MTVKDLILELKEYPQDLPVVSAHKEINKIEVNNDFYYINENNEDYSIGSFVVLE